jgi:hypothetical protein
MLVLKMKSVKGKVDIRFEEVVTVDELKYRGIGGSSRKC